MKKLIFQSGVLVALLALMSTSYAQGFDIGPVQGYVPVFCDQGHSLQTAVNKAREGNLIDVYGTCTEAVEVRRDGLKIGAFDGQEAFINPPEGSPAFTIVSADNVLIELLNITITGGGSHGIGIFDGSSAVINANMITGANIGIWIESNSQANLISNEITSSGSLGIHVNSSSHAALDGNTVTMSGNDGVAVAMGSVAHVRNNTISDNVMNGIRVEPNATIRFGAINTIEGNGSFGVSCEEAAVVVVAAVQSFSGNTLGPVEIQTPPPCFVKKLVVDPAFP